MKQIPFKGIVVWSYSVNLHTDAVFSKLAELCEVTLCTMRKEFRDLGNPITGKIRYVHIRSTEDFPTELFTKEYLHIGPTKRVEHFNGVAYEGFTLALKKNLPTMALNVEQYPWWEGAKGLLRRLQWFYIYNFSLMRKIKAIGCQGESGVLAYRKCFIKSSRLFEFVYSPPRVSTILPPSYAQTEYSIPILFCWPD